MTTRDRNAVHGWPMASLRVMLSEREIPIYENVRALRRELDAPGRITLEDLLRLPPNGNFVTHESAHAIAFSLLFGGNANSLAFPATLSSSERREKILRTQLCESFANVCEVHALARSTNGIGKLFALCSFYGPMRDESRRDWMVLQDAYGEAKTIALGALAFLRSNFLFKKTPVSERRRCMARLGLKAGRGSTVERAAKGVFELAHKLNPRFLLGTTRVYFRQQGLTINLHRALDFDFMAMIDNNADLTECFFALVELVA